MNIYMRARTYTYESNIHTFVEMTDEGFIHATSEYM